jgi:hypothetical protein
MKRQDSVDDWLVKITTTVVVATTTVIPSFFDCWEFSSHSVYVDSMALMQEIQFLVLHHL